MRDNSSRGGEQVSSARSVFPKKLCKRSVVRVIHEPQRRADGERQSVPYHLLYYKKKFVFLNLNQAVEKD